MPIKRDLTGLRFGFLVVKGQAPSRNGHVMWICDCDCGKQSLVAGNNLTKKRHIKSCGCYRKPTLCHPEREHEALGLCHDCYHEYHTEVYEARDCAKRNHTTDIKGVERALLQKECALCPSKVDLHVDHDHKTGRVRDRLYGSCNRGLGLFKDDPELLRKAIAYLEKWL